MLRRFTDSYIFRLCFSLLFFGFIFSIPNLADAQVVKSSYKYKGHSLIVEERAAVSNRTVLTRKNYATPLGDHQKRGKKLKKLLKKLSGNQISSSASATTFVIGKNYSFDEDIKMISAVKANNPCRKLRVKALRRLAKNSGDKSLRLIANGLYECSPDWIQFADKPANDTRFIDMWSLRAPANSIGGYGIGANLSWDEYQSGDGMRVCVIDTGIDFRHEDLVGNVWVNPAEVIGDGIDNDGNGYVDDIHGINAINGTGRPIDDHSHGTHVAGTIVGRGNNSLGITGVSWRGRVISAKFLGANGSGTISNAIRAIDYCEYLKRVKEPNLKTTNNSWGGGGYSTALYNSIVRLRDSGALFIAAAGNSNINNDSIPHYPANYNVSNVISVAALASNGTRASFSNYGANTVHIAAPGVGIWSTTPNNQYAQYSGTSMAAPHVAAAAAIISVQKKAWNINQIRSAILNTSFVTTGLSNSPQRNLTGLVNGARRLDLHALVVYAKNN